MKTFQNAPKWASCFFLAIASLINGRTTGAVWFSLSLWHEGGSGTKRLRFAPSLPYLAPKNRARAETALYRWRCSSAHGAAFRVIKTIHLHADTATVCLFFSPLLFCLLLFLRAVAATSLDRVLCSVSRLRLSVPADCSGNSVATRPSTYRAKGRVVCLGAVLRLLRG